MVFYCTHNLFAGQFLKNPQSYWRHKKWITWVIDCYDVCLKSVTTILSFHSCKWERGKHKTWDPLHWGEVSDSVNQQQNSSVSLVWDNCWNQTNNVFTHTLQWQWDIFCLLSSWNIWLNYDISVTSMYLNYWSHIF